MICTRCDGSGFLNIEQVPQELHGIGEDAILKWMAENPLDHDVTVCDCCGDGDSWYGLPGRHFEGGDDARSYAYNGGLPECN